MYTKMTVRNITEDKAHTVRKAIDEYISGLGDQLHELNRKVRIPTESKTSTN